MTEPTRPVLNQATLDRLRDMALLSRESRLVARLTDLFIEDTDARLVAMRSAVERGEDDALRALAHTMRGAAATLGASEMVELCSELELLPGRWSAARKTRSVEALRVAFARTRTALLGFVAEVASSLATD
jgi:HPt (histidine-containing phosphotransfer) domain-containing protein